MDEFRYKLLESISRYNHNTYNHKKDAFFKRMKENHKRNSEWSKNT